MKIGTIAFTSACALFVLSWTTVSLFTSCAGRG